MNVQKHFYFSSLDGLRFFAFLLVFLHHTTFYINSTLVGNFIFSFFNKNGWIGVAFFFVLTGFLITLLLLDERKRNGFFSFKNFLIRRALRIWPLYYLAIIFGFFIIPFLYTNVFSQQFSFNEISPGLPWYLTFSGNWYVALNGYADSNSRSISQLWAISLDQQLYFIWPMVLLFAKSFKSLLVINLSTIFISISIRIYLKSTGVEHPGIYANTFSWLEAFAYGALAAQLLFFKSGLLSKMKNIFSLHFQLISIIFLTGFLYLATLDDRLAIRNGVWGYTVIGIISAYLILSLITNSSALSKFMENKYLGYLGKISYGLYIWHILALEILFFLIPNHNILLVIFGLPLTILFGIISYKYFENPFLRLKNKFTEFR